MRIGGKIGVGVAVLGLVFGTAQAAGAASPPGAAASDGSRPRQEHGHADHGRPGRRAARQGQNHQAWPGPRGNGVLHVQRPRPRLRHPGRRAQARRAPASSTGGCSTSPRCSSSATTTRTATSVPLIVTHTAGRAAPRLAQATRDLPSVDGIGHRRRQVRHRLGRAHRRHHDAHHGRRRVEKVWLDGKRKSTLDHSVPQIGAPAAWEAGLTGAGVKVAVLDTGVDQTHPDLADREIAEQNFTEAPDNVDNFGHGTHVASIVAGTGAKSGGKYRGVAPERVDPRRQGARRLRRAARSRASSPAWSGPPSRAPTSPT